MIYGQPLSFERLILYFCYMLFRYRFDVLVNERADWITVCKGTPPPRDREPEPVRLKLHATRCGGPKSAAKMAYRRKTSDFSPERSTTLEQGED